MAADTGIFLVLAVHHGHRVPADQALDAPLQHAISGIRVFLLHRDGVDVGSVQLHRNLDPRLSCALDQGFQKFASAGGAFILHHLVKGFQPLRYFLFRINFGFRRKLQYSIVDFLGCHIDLCNLPARC